MRSDLLLLGFAGYHPNRTGCPTLAVVILSERSESKDLYLANLRLGWDSTVKNGSAFR
jgi:hypothetical protein